MESRGSRGPRAGRYPWRPYHQLWPKTRSCSLSSAIAQRDSRSMPRPAFRVGMAGPGISTGRCTASDRSAGEGTFPRERPGRSANPVGCGGLERVRRRRVEPPHHRRPLSGGWRPVANRSAGSSTASRSARRALIATNSRSRPSAIARSPTAAPGSGGLASGAR